MELPKGSAMDSRSGSMREVSGDFRPSISFSVSQPMKTVSVSQNKHRNVGMQILRGKRKDNGGFESQTSDFALPNKNKQLNY